MKITHISLCGPVTDNFTYQDNLLPKYHKKMGLEVSMITSKYIWGKDGIDKDVRDVYMNEYGIKTIRLKNKFKTNINSKFKRYYKLYDTIENENPDILFIHSVQFLDMKEIVRYVKNKPVVRVYVDNHADFSNSATNWFSKQILHKYYWKKTAKLIEPYTDMFYGVLPARVDFLRDVYNIPAEKVELLVLGADDEKVEKVVNKDTKLKIRKQMNIKKDDFLIVTGGKIDNAKKQVINLMNAVSKMNNPTVKLIVFGSVIPEMEDQVKKIAKNDSISYIGWIEDNLSYQLFAAADLVVFPGRHSVYWEQVVAIGTPMIIKYWNGTTHVNIGGNCKYLYEDSEDEILEKLNSIVNNDKIYHEMSKNAKKEKRTEFFYSRIAENSIVDSWEKSKY